MHHAALRQERGLPAAPVYPMPHPVAAVANGSPVCPYQQYIRDWNCRELLQQRGRQKADDQSRCSLRPREELVGPEAPVTQPLDKSPSRPLQKPAG